MSKLVYSAIQTPDKTILESRNRHDYKEYTDTITKEVYMIDGGCDYFRGSVNKVPAKRIAFFEDDDIEDIREYWSWGSYGPEGDQPLRYILLKDMEEDHMKAISDNCTKYWDELFNRELGWRKESFEKNSRYPEKYVRRVVDEFWKKFMGRVG